MIVFLQIIITLGLIAFPTVLGALKGNITYTLYWGFVLGIHYDKLYVKNEYEDDTSEIVRLNMIQFHLFFITILMIFPTKTNL
jgi:hypothetical protein